MALLFVAATLLPMFLPTGLDIDLFTRALVAFALFNAAMAAEVFRGGLQVVGLGQTEAATTVGLSDFAALRLIRLMSDFREAMWGTVQAVLSELDFDYGAYADEHFERLLEGARDPRFQEWVQHGPTA